MATLQVHIGCLNAVQVASLGGSCSEHLEFGRVQKEASLQSQEGASCNLPNTTYVNSLVTHVTFWSHYAS